MDYLKVSLSDLPYGSEFSFRPNGPIWIKCSEIWINQFGYSVISAFQGDHYAWHYADCQVYKLPLVPVFQIGEQLSLF